MWRKALYVAVVGPLTGMACMGCYWQYNRYLSSVPRFANLKKSLL